MLRGDYQEEVIALHHHGRPHRADIEFSEFTARLSLTAVGEEEGSHGCAIPIIGIVIIVVYRAIICTVAIIGTHGSRVGDTVQKYRILYYTEV